MTLPRGRRWPRQGRPLPTWASLPCRHHLPDDDPHLFHACHDLADRPSGHPFGHPCDCPGGHRGGRRDGRRNGLRGVSRASGSDSVGATDADGGVISSDAAISTAAAISSGAEATSISPPCDRGFGSAHAGLCRAAGCCPLLRQTSAPGEPCFCYPSRQVSWSAASPVGSSAVDLPEIASQPSRARLSPAGTLALRVPGQMRVCLALPPPPQNSARWARFLPSLQQTFAEVDLKALVHSWVH